MSFEEKFYLDSSSPVEAGYSAKELEALLQHQNEQSPPFQNLKTLTDIARRQGETYLIPQHRLVSCLLGLETDFKEQGITAFFMGDLFENERNAVINLLKALEFISYPESVDRFRALHILGFFDRFDANHMAKNSGQDIFYWAKWPPEGLDDIAFLFACFPREKPEVLLHLFNQLLPHVLNTENKDTFGKESEVAKFFSAHPSFIEKIKLLVETSSASEEELQEALFSAIEAKKPEGFLFFQTLETFKSNLNLLLAHRKDINLSLADFLSTNPEAMSPMINESYHHKLHDAGVARAFFALSESFQQWLQQNVEFHKAIAFLGFPEQSQRDFDEYTITLARRSCRHPNLTNLFIDLYYDVVVYEPSSLEDERLANKRALEHITGFERELYELPVETERLTIENAIKLNISELLFKPLRGSYPNVEIPESGMKILKDQIRSINYLLNLDEGSIITPKFFDLMNSGKRLPKYTNSFTIFAEVLQQIIRNASLDKLDQAVMFGELKTYLFNSEITDLRRCRCTSEEIIKSLVQPHLSLKKAKAISVNESKLSPKKWLEKYYPNFFYSPDASSSTGEHGDGHQKQSDSEEEEEKEKKAPPSGLPHQ